MNHVTRLLLIAALIPCLGALPACAPDGRLPKEPADLVLTHGRVYTFAWDDPAPDGAPAANAPHDRSGWQPDGEAIAVKSGRILHVGSNEEAEAFRVESTRVIDLQGATVLPGLVDSHTHIARLGATLEQVPLFDLATEEAMVKRVAERAARIPEGQWIFGYGWDEGPWADDFPTMALLSARVPNHPVFLRGLHGIAVWGNRLALQKAAITRDTESPEGGEILKDVHGNPTGVLLHRATTLLEKALPASDRSRLETRILAGLEEMAASGFVMVHEAGADGVTTGAYEELANRHQLPIRVSLMLSARDEELMQSWLERGPEVIILDEPTRGVDIGAKAEIHALIDRLAASGRAILLISSDLPEILGVSDRVLVMHQGRISAELRGPGLSQENVILAASGLPMPPDGRSTSSRRLP